MIRLRRRTDQIDRFSRSNFELHPLSSERDAAPKTCPMGVAIRIRAALFVDILGRNRSPLQTVGCKQGSTPPFFFHPTSRTPYQAKN